MPPLRDPFASFERMRREFDEVFGSALDRGGLGLRRGFSPRVDVCYCGEPPRAIVNADLAGVDVGTIRLEIHGRRLVISGERRRKDPEGRVYQQVEIEQGPFRRVVELSADLAADRAEASYDAGILHVEVPLAEKGRAVREVPIETEGASEAR